MPAHIHPAPACSQKVGGVCTPTTCTHFDSCRNGGTLLTCEVQADGTCFCFHSYWVGEGGFEVPPAHQPQWRDPTEPQSLEQSLSRFRPHPLPRVLNQDGRVRPTGVNVAVAYKMIEEFVTDTRPGAFPKISRFSVAKGVLDRINQPDRIDQGAGWWCGPASFIHALVRQDPAACAQYVFDLYNEGRAIPRGGGMIAPSHDFRLDAVPIGEDSADWIALGSLRDSSNWIFEYHRNTWFERMEHIRGGTSARDVEKWFKNFGFREVINKTSSSACDLDNLKLADSYARRNYRVVLFIDSNVILGGPDEAKAGGAADHFIVLSGPINYGPPIKMRVFTWRQYQTIPDVDMTATEFLNSYHGFIAARR